MNCFFLFDLLDEKVTFHAEYCTERAVHTLDGIVDDTEKLCAVAATDISGIVQYLTGRFSSDNGLFPFLEKNGIPFSITEKSYADSSSDV